MANADPAACAVIDQASARLRDSLDGYGIDVIVVREGAGGGEVRRRCVKTELVKHYDDGRVATIGWDGKPEERHLLAALADDAKIDVGLQRFDDGSPSSLALRRLRLGHWSLFVGHEHGPPRWTLPRVSWRRGKGITVGWWYTAFYVWWAAS